MPKRQANTPLNMNEQLPNIDVWMIHHRLQRAPVFALPRGYRMRFYAEGDIQTWVAIQQAAEPFFVPTAETFLRYMPGDISYVSRRVMFLADPNGRDIGTITAWNDQLFQHNDIGQIHWVAIIPEAQGRGLAKPMLSAACAELQARGYTAAVLETNTRRIAALNLYLQFGFEPYPHTQAERDAWLSAAPHLKFGVHV